MVVTFCVLFVIDKARPVMFSCLIHLGYEQCIVVFLCFLTKFTKVICALIIEVVLEESSFIKFSCQNPFLKKYPFRFVMF